MSYGFTNRRALGARMGRRDKVKLLEQEVVKARAEQATARRRWHNAQRAAMNAGRDALVGSRGDKEKARARQDRLQRKANQLNEDHIAAMRRTNDLEDELIAMVLK